MSIAPLKSIRYWKSWGVLENPADILHDRHENAQNWWRNGLRKINLKLATPSQLNQNSLYWICPIFRGGVANYKLIFLRNSATICKNFDACQLCRIHVYFSQNAPTFISTFKYFRQVMAISMRIAFLTPWRMLNSKITITI